VRYTAIARFLRAKYARRTVKISQKPPSPSVHRLFSRRRAAFLFFPPKIYRIRPTRFALSFALPFVK